MARGSFFRLTAALLLSAVWPGLGSLIVGQPLLGLTLMAATVVSLLATMLFYGYVTTPILWLAGLVLAAVGARRRSAGRPQWPARRFRTFLGFVVLCIGGLVAFHIRWTAPRAPGTVQTLRAVPPAGPSSDTVAWIGPTGLHTIDPAEHPALTVNELGHLRWWMAIAGQPLGEWEGLYSLDQFGQTALRYQLAFAAYGLAQAQAARLPAYRSPISGALKSLVEKMLHQDVWNYWQWESLAGFGHKEEDPVAEANVMYSGHLASMAGLARLISGEKLYRSADSLTFVKDRRTVASYSYRSMLGVLARQFRTNPWHAIACEPHQAFVMCNNHAALGLLLGSRLLEEGSFREAVAYYTNAYIGLFRANGEEPSLRYPYYPPLDRTLPFHLMLGDGWSIATLHGLMPEEARLQYQAFRWRVFGSAKDGPRTVPSSPFYESVDVGNMRLSAASQAAFALFGAREMGDGPGARELLVTIESRYGPRWIGGRRTYRDLSPLLHAVVFLARLTPPGGFGTLFTEARVVEAWDKPHLETVQGGELDVVQAAYVPSEEALIVGLVAGREEGRRTLVIAGLDPSRRYILVTNGRVAAASLRPKPDGTLKLPVAKEVPVRCVLAAFPRGT